MDDTATTTTYLYTNTVQGICVLLYDNVEKKIYVMKSLSEIHNCDNIVKSFRFLSLFAITPIGNFVNSSEKFPCNLHILLSCYVTEKIK